MCLLGKCAWWKLCGFVALVCLLRAIVLVVDLGVVGYLLFVGCVVVFWVD